ncbi:MAG: hypothetical protein KGS61_16955 [Verrucomicrobia bacterium]|nr:hypothetical protein [Verrucomicrobiota bacterium]
MPVVTFEGNGNAGWPGWLHSPPMFERKFLKPGEVVILEVPEPTSNGIWRAVFSYDPKTTRHEYWVATVQGIGRLFGQNVGLGLPNSKSEWITRTNTSWTNWSEPAR